jgi:hypothetical protein
MSHRITVQTDIKDSAALEQALGMAKVNFQTKDNIVQLDTHPYRGTTINLQTGVIQSGDVDFAKTKDKDIGLLKAYYTEVKHKMDAIKLGTQILSREEVLHEGRSVIVVTGRMAG